MLVDGPRKIRKLNPNWVATPNSPVFPAIAAPVNPRPALIDNRFGHPLLWLLLAAAGLGLLVVNPLVYAIYSLDYAFFGLLLVGSSSIGLSTYVSFYTQQPRYDLWVKLLAFIQDHKTFVGCVGLGIVMLNPWVTLLMGGIGNLIDLALGEELSLFEAFARRQIQTLIQALSPDSLQAYKVWIRANPGRSLSLLLGMSLGISLAVLVYPFAFPAYASLYFSLETLLFDAIAPNLLAIQGGMVPFGLLLAASFSFQAMLFVTPLALSMGLSSRISYMLWEKTRDFMTPYAQICHAQFTRSKTQMAQFSHRVGVTAHAWQERGRAYLPRFLAPQALAVPIQQQVDATNQLLRRVRIIN